MKCYFCGSELIWQSDDNYNDVCNDNFGVITCLICSNKECNAIVETTRINNKEE